MDSHNKYKCYDDIVVGKSFFKGEKKNNLVYFERSILNMMIMDNYLKLDQLNKLKFNALKKSKEFTIINHHKTLVKLLEKND